MTALKFAALAAISLSLLGQDGSVILPSVEGEITEGRQGAPYDLLVELAERGRPAYQAPVRYDWTFEFNSVPAGLYEVRIVNYFGEILRREQVFVREHSAPLALKLPVREMSRPVSGTVSIKRLAPDKARKELLRAEQASVRGKVDESIRRLENAIRIHPGYVEAHNNLGVRYMAQGDFSRAAQQFRRAAELDSSAARAHSNLALALIALKEYAEARTQARRALELEPDFLEARYASGLIDAGLNNCTREAAENLKKAGERFARARLAAAHVLECQGETGEAAAQLRAYLGSPNAPKRDQVHQWLERLATSDSGRRPPPAPGR